MDITYLLDTDTCIDILRGNPAVTARFLLVSERCSASAITAFELIAGPLLAQRPQEELESVRLFLSRLVELGFEHADGEVAARIHAELRRQGLPIGAYDLLIAGHAFSRGLTLVTSNLREFQRVDALAVESWR